LGLSTPDVPWAAVSLVALASIVLDGVLSVSPNNKGPRPPRGAR